jgi:hypothetical protein
VINPAQIPDEVVEAAAKAAWETKYKGLGWLLDCPEKHKVQWRDRARAAIAAALNAWPNAKTLRDDGRRQTYIVPALILPFSTETSNDR